MLGVNENQDIVCRYRLSLLSIVNVRRMFLGWEINACLILENHKPWIENDLQ